jgi:hypothetical protein
MIASIVSALCVLIGAIVTARAKVRVSEEKARASEEKAKADKSEAKLVEIQQQIEVSSRAFEEQMKQKYGISATTLASRCEILNTNGDAKIVRSWTGLKLAAGVTMDRLPGHFVVAGPGARISGKPKLNAPLSFVKNLTLEVTLDTPTRCEYVVRTIGPLNSDDPPLNYSVEISFEKAFAMWSEDIEAAYGGAKNFPFEFHGISVELPADDLLLEVSFPENYFTDSFANIFFMGSEETYGGPASKLNADRIGRLTRLQVKPPLLGFRYIIFWKGSPKVVTGIPTR